MQTQGSASEPKDLTLIQAELQRENSWEPCVPHAGREQVGGGVWADGSKEAFSKRSLMEFEILEVELAY